jgi:hypothetical protein
MKVKHQDPTQASAAFTVAQQLGDIQRLQEKRGVERDYEAATLE